MTVIFLPLQEPEKKKEKKKKKKKQGKKENKQAETSDTATVKTASDTTLQTPATTIIQSPAAPQKIINYDLFKGHSLKVKNPAPLPNTSAREDWFPMVIIFIVLLLSLVNVLYQKKFREFIESLFRRYSPQSMREDNVFTQRLRILLFIIFCLITSTFIYEAASVYQLQPSKLTGFQFFNVILFIIFSIYLLKMGLLKLMGFIFKVEREQMDYSNNILLYLNILSFGLLPLVILIGFTESLPVETLIKTGWVFILCAILFRIGRGYVMAVSNPLLSKFYLFLYLCTLEILPLVVILKIFVGQLL